MKKTKRTAWILGVMMLVFLTGCSKDEGELVCCKAEISVTNPIHSEESKEEETQIKLIMDDNIAFNELFVGFIAGEIKANSYKSEDEKYLSDYYEEYSQHVINAVCFMLEDLNGDGEDELLINIRWNADEGEILVFHSQDECLFEWESILYGMHSPTVYLYRNIIEVTGHGWSRSFFHYNSQGQLERVFDCYSESDTLENGASQRRYTIIEYQGGIEIKELSITEVAYSDKENDWEVLERREEEEQFDKILNSFLNKLGEGKQINQIQDDGAIETITFEELMYYLAADYNIQFDAGSTEKEITDAVFYWESEKYFYLIEGEWIAEEYAGSIRDNHFDEAREEWYQEEMQEYTDGVIEKYLGSEWCIEINNLEYLGPYVDLKFIMEDNSELFNIARLIPEENITINPPYIGLSAQLKDKDERYRFIIDTDGTVLIELENSFFRLEKKSNN